MIAKDREALICDLAETYGIFDFRALPATLLATLAVGLRGDSRIKMRLSGQTVTRNELFLAAAVDRLSLLAWFMSEDGQRGVNRPASMVDILMGDATQSNDIETFDSGEDFDTEWRRRTGVTYGG